MTTRPTPATFSPLRVSIAVLVGISVILLFATCAPAPDTVSKQVNRATPKVTKTAEGITLEQENIRAYRETFSDPKIVKHLYVFNDIGNCIFYDTVRGKVTSGGKRLRPRSVWMGRIGNYDREYAIPVSVNGKTFYTTEVPAFDGTFGTSEAYIYWRNTTNQFRKLSLGAGMSVITTTVPLRFIQSIVDLSNIDDSGNAIPLRVR